MEETIAMSKKEIDRFAVLEQVRNKKLKQRQAAEILGISDRQVRNLLAVVKVRIHPWKSSYLKVKELVYAPLMGIAKGLAPLPGFGAEPHLSKQVSAYGASLPPLKVELT